MLIRAGSQGKVTGGIHLCTKSPPIKGSVQEMEAVSVHSEGIQGQSLSVQGWIYKDKAQIEMSLARDMKDTENK